MSIERNLRLALHQLVEAIEYTPMGVRGIKAMANARKALEDAQQPATGEPIGYMNAGNIHELKQGALPYGYVYPQKESGVSVPVYARPAPGVPDDMVRDAERYQWLRKWKGQEHEPPFTVQHEFDGTIWGGDLDSAIDAAMLTAAQAQKGQP